MENLFLAVIAFNALITAVIVGGLAYGFRQVNRKLDDLESQVDREVMPKLQEFARVAHQMAEAAADARRRVSRAGVVVSERAEQVHRLVGGTLERVAGVAEQAAGFAGQVELEDEAPETEEEVEAAR
jgi:hypothetical protein